MKSNDFCANFEFFKFAEMVALPFGVRAAPLRFDLEFQKQIRNLNAPPCAVGTSEAS
jgi:hypothetical protein